MCASRGRIVTVRRIGKAGFAHLCKTASACRSNVRKMHGREQIFALYQLLDIRRRRRRGWILFSAPRRANLANMSSACIFLAKTLYSMPEKVARTGRRRNSLRQRYLDLIAIPGGTQSICDAAKIVLPRAAPVGTAFVPGMETPMLHRSTAERRRVRSRTHHNTLDIDLYLRISARACTEAAGSGRHRCGVEIQTQLSQRGNSTHQRIPNYHARVLSGRTPITTADGLSEELLGRLRLTPQVRRCAEFQGEKSTSRKFRTMTMREAVG